MSLMCEHDKKMCYGDMTEEEIKLVYRHEGTYKGWICHYTGLGRLMFIKGMNEVEAQSDKDDWVPWCWNICKKSIDDIEAVLANA